MPEFHRLEEYGIDINSTKKAIICSFKTERFGYLQTELTVGEDRHWTLKTLRNEPDLNMFTNSDIAELQLKSLVIWRMVYDAPAIKSRFE